MDIALSHQVKTQTNQNGILLLLIAWKCPTFSPLMTGAHQYSFPFQRNSPSSFVSFLSLFQMILKELLQIFNFFLLLPFISDIYYVILFCCFFTSFSFCLLFLFYLINDVFSRILFFTYFSLVLILHIRLRLGERVILQTLQVQRIGTTMASLQLWINLFCCCCCSTCFSFSSSSFISHSIT